MVKGSSDLGLQRVEVVIVLIGLKDVCFQFSFDPIFSTISQSYLGWQSLPVQGTLFGPFRTSTGFH